MRVKWLCALSSISLIGLSSISYASWTKYGPTYTPGSPIPKSDCLEMMCKYGCVEDDDSGTGYCCSAGQLGDKCWGGQCCQEGLVCSSDTGEGVCEHSSEECEGKAADFPCKKCNTNTKKWDLADDTNTEGLTECQKCNKGKVAIDQNKTIGECGKCNSAGVVVKNTGITVPTCKKCDTNEGSNTRWQWVNDENKPVNDCGICVEGEVQENTLINTPTCKKCDTADGSKTQWKWVPDELLEGTRPEGMDICHMCKRGTSVLEDSTKAEICGEKCCTKCNSQGTDCALCVSDIANTLNSKVRKKSKEVNLFYTNNGNTPNYVDGYEVIIDSWCFIPCRSQYLNVEVIDIPNIKASCDCSVDNHYKTYTCSTATCYEFHVQKNGGEISSISNVVKGGTQSTTVGHTCGGSCTDKKTVSCKRNGSTTDCSYKAYKNCTDSIYLEAGVEYCVRAKIEAASSSADIEFH